MKPKGKSAGRWRPARKAANLREEMYRVLNLRGITFEMWISLVKENFYEHPYCVIAQRSCATKVIFCGTLSDAEIEKRLWEEARNDDLRNSGR
jgi:hypothetical protein